MPINVYAGLQGSGKSYEVVSSVILDALAVGRRVVTNVDGIDNDACRAYVHEKRDIPMDRIGHVVHCTNERVLEENFFPHGTAAETFVQGGDLVAIDEAWRFWAGDSKISHEHRVFFREHRHYTHPVTKVSCDLVCMTQDIGDLNRLLKAVVELSFRTTKIKQLGLNRSYRIEMWEGWKQIQKARIRVENKNYKAEVFPLYSSYVGGKGNEVQVDKRQNVLRNPSLWLFAVLFVLFAWWGGSHLYRFFRPADVQRVGERVRPPADVASSPVPGSAVPGGQSSSLASVIKQPEGDRLVGSFTVRGQSYLLLVNGETFRPQSPSMAKGDGLMQTVPGERGDKTARRFVLISSSTGANR
jgi:zona occludens toxin